MRNQLKYAKCEINNKTTSSEVIYCGQNIIKDMKKYNLIDEGIYIYETTTQVIGTTL